MLNKNICEDKTDSYVEAYKATFDIDVKSGFEPFMALTICDVFATINFINKNLWRYYYG